MDRTKLTNRIRKLIPLVFLVAFLTSRDGQSVQGSIPVSKDNKTPYYKLAKISMDKAIEIASSSMQGTPTEAELGVEDGFLVYEIELSNGTESKTEVIVDAGTGSIIKQENEEEHSGSHHVTGDDDDDRATGNGDDNDDDDNDDNDDDDEAMGEAKNQGMPHTSLQNAVKAALLSTPGTPVEAELEKKGNRLFYEIEIIDANGKTSKVKINSDTGAVE